jgi:hypothetical protein
MKKASLLIILILAGGCEDQNVSNLKLSIPIPNSANYNKELLNGFEGYIDTYRQSIEELLVKYGITPKSLLSNTDWFDIKVFSWKINIDSDKIRKALTFV